MPKLDATRYNKFDLIFSKVSIVDFNGRQDIWLCSNILWVQYWDWCWDWWLFCSVLASRDALLVISLLVWLVTELMVLVFFCGCIWRLFSEKRQCWMVLIDLLQYQHRTAYFSFCVLKIQTRRDSIHYFSAKFWTFDWGFHCIIPINKGISICLFFLSLDSRLRLVTPLV